MRELGTRALPVEAFGRHDVADEQRNPCLGALNHHGRGRHRGKRLQCGLDLAELDPATADLHLIVGAALEQQADRIEPHEVARAISPVPAEARHGGVLLGILHRIEVAGEADAADDELAHGAVGHPVAGRVDDRERPALERQADADRPLAVEQRCAGDDRRLGRAVGVPQLAPVGDEPCDEFGRAGLAAEDQQPDVLDRVLRPEGGERRHGRDDRDAVADEPRPEVLARAHERARRGDQTRTVAPRKPHLLARRVERDREAGQHAVARTQGGGSQEQARFGIDERRCRAVRDGDALRHPGGA